MVEAPTPEFFRLHRHDARYLEALLRPHSSPTRPLLATTITSPPYGRLKDYGDENQVGHGQSYSQYLADMRSIFGSIHTHTRATGSLWVVADTFRSHEGSPAPLVPLPFDLAAEASEVGWTLRDVIVWRKDRTLPWSNGTRLRNAFEYVLLLVKGCSPTYHPERLREVSGLKQWWVRFPERYSPEGRAPTNVWDIPIPLQGSWGTSDIAHECPLPAALVERLVTLSTDPGDVVFDCFAGSGVVLGEAERLGRRALGCELAERRVREYELYVRPELAERGRTTTISRNGQEAQFREAITSLRMTKFPRVVMERIARQRRDLPWPVLALMLKRRATQKEALAAASLVLIVDAPRAARQKVADVAREICKRPPASKFGLEVSLEVAPPARVVKLVRGRRVYLYANGVTHRASDPLPHGGILAASREHQGDRIPPIVSDSHAQVPRALLPSPGLSVR